MVAGYIKRGTALTLTLRFVAVPPKVLLEKKYLLCYTTTYLKISLNMKRKISVLQLCIIFVGWFVGWLLPL
jgi:hypothetical protein